MFKKIKGWLIAILMIAAFSSNIAVAQEVQRVETDGTIGFTGVYEPIGTPDPTPPENVIRPPVTDITKPGGRLPQTNDLGHSWLTWLGVLIASFVFLLWKRNKKQNTKYKIKQ